MRVLLKREDLTHTGSHKINNVLGQALLTRRMGKRRVIAETGAGQHGVATATAAALFGLDCVVFMGAVDTERQALNVFRMKLLGADVVPVTGGSATLKDAINEALRDWVATVESTHYCIGSVVGPHPYPWMVREFQRVVGDEAREQCRALLGGDDPDMVVACVGGGSNAIGTFAGFLDTRARLVGIEAGGYGLESGQHGASVARGVPGVLHGARSLFLQDEDGQILEAHSISAGLDYPGVGPEHAELAASGRAEYQFATDDEALAGLQLLSVTEGIVPALEPAHAIGWLAREAGRAVPSGSTVLVTLSGRGDKDAAQVAERLTGERLGVISLEAHLRARRAAGHKLLVPYVTGGLEGWLDVVRAVADAGADAVEIGIPFSDPVMDGVTIQEASQRALRDRRHAGGHHRRGRRARRRHPARGDDLHQPGRRTWGSAASRRRWSAPGSRARSCPTCRSTSSTAGATPPTPPASRPCCSPRPPPPTTACGRSASAATGSCTACRSWASRGSGRALASQAREMGRRCKAVTDKPVLLGVGISTAEQAVRGRGVRRRCGRRAARSSPGCCAATDRKARTR